MVVHQRGEDLLRHIAGELGIFAEKVEGLAQQGLRPGALAEGLGFRLLLQCLHIGLEEGLCLPQTAQPGPAASLHHTAHGGAGKPQDLTDVGHSADGVEILLPRQIHADLPLGHQENLLIGLHGPLQGRNGDAPLYVKGQIHMGEHRKPPQGQYRNVPARQFHGGTVLSHLGGKVCRA